jgi:hypothetical protein
MTFPTACRAVTLLLALAVGGCAGSPSLLEPDATPRLDCRAPFQEAANAGPAQPQGPSGLQRALSRAGWPADASGRSPRSVLLGGRLVGELPEPASGSWRWLSSEDLTLLIHSPEEGRPPDALLYAEAFSARQATRPTEELMRFELTVDPALLGDQLTWPTRTTAWVEAVGGPAGDRENLRRLAWMSMTRTGGRGFGYTSSPRQFTGWKWMGRNRRGVFFRLGRTQGEWAAQKPLDPQLERLLPRLLQRFPDKGWLDAAGVSGPWAAGGGGRAPAVAYMVFGTAAADESGIHLAVLCAQSPVCGPAQELAGLLDSLRRPGSGEVDGLLTKTETGSVESLAAEMGFILRDTADR